MKNNYEVYGANFIPRTNCENPSAKAYVRETSANRQVLAMAYVPVQTGINPQYSPEEGFCAGTLFKELDLPWEGVLYCD